jgi:hypothetical protein
MCLFSSCFNFLLFIWPRDAFYVCRISKEEKLLGFFSAFNCHSDKHRNTPTVTRCFALSIYDLLVWVYDNFESVYSAEQI